VGVCECAPQNQSAEDGKKCHCQKEGDWDFEDNASKNGNIGVKGRRGCGHID
jgi:hypothetical protein